MSQDLESLEPENEPLEPGEVLPVVEERRRDDQGKTDADNRDQTEQDHSPPPVRCEVCGGLLYESDFFCHTCGREAPYREDRRPSRQMLSTHNFECTSCGASMSYDASAKALRCPFCGSVDLQDRPDAPAVEPDFIIPFRVDRQQAQRILRAELDRGFWRPGDLATSAAVVRMTPVLAPFWIFSADTHSYWTADTSQRYSGQRADWRPVTGDNTGKVENLLVCASGVLTLTESIRIQPYDLNQGQSPHEFDLENIVYEQFSMPRKYARPLAAQGIEAMEREACTQHVPGQSRNLRVNVLVTNMDSRPAMLPVWIMAYRYKDQLYRFLINGQTGKPCGIAPESTAKKIAFAGMAIVFIILAVLLMMLFSSNR